MKNKPIIIIAGEPYGVFLEIFFKTIKNNNFNKPIILIVSEKFFMQQMKIFKYNFKINLLNNQEFTNQDLDIKKINIINVTFKFKKVFDKISDNSNSYIEQSFKIALNILKKKKCSGLINGPISKKHFLKKNFFGITEYLGHKTKKKNISMLIYNKKLSVCPITTHLPLKDIHKYLSKNKIIDQIKLITLFYKKHFKINPKIGITGLNPHCESNYDASEEDRIIKPAIRYLLKRGYKVKGPFSADTIFMRENLNKYDVIVGMFHDQVLTPAKALYGFNAINITLGLPFIRISPDHGPNAAMLGKNLSSPKSLIQAIRFLDN